MLVSADKLKEILTEPGHVDPHAFTEAEEEAVHRGVPVGDVLVEKGFIKDKELGKLLADYSGQKFLDLSQEKVETAILSLIPEVVARGKGIVPVRLDGDELVLGMRDPRDLEMIRLVEKKSGHRVRPYLVTARSLDDTLSRYKPGLKDVFQRIIERLSDVTISREERDAETVKMVDTLLVYGYENQASDIHLEPYESSVSVRFRIDGVMHDVLRFPKELYDYILTRIKILARLRTDLHRAAQDGKIRMTRGGEQVDIRVSIVPVTEGENVVMRILSSRNRRFALEDLGLLPRDLTKVLAAVKKPHGMVLVTGPTGSGKTTTLYSMLKILNTRDVHIATIEDPVEYDVEGVSQIQTDPKTGLTFARGLRAIVRQDPDIIMVGEIRDEETADIAVNSAMTGHLVLSTLHANNAATTLPRLLDMGVEPFLIASTINIVIAQRLVRKIHERCRASAVISDEERRMIEGDEHLSEIFARRGKAVERILVYEGKGCDACGNTGYFGRIGIFEVLIIDEYVKDLIVHRAASTEIMKAARSRGMVTMLEDGVEKMFQGVTTLREVFRVTRE